jgi:hypothetical protein
LSIILSTILSVIAAANVATAQALAPPLYPNITYFGYYYSDSKYGDYSNTVYAYTNLFIAIPGGSATTDVADWQTPLRSELQRAVNSNKRILLLMADAGSNAGAQVFSWDSVLDVADDFWASIDFVSIYDDNVTGTITAQQLADDIASLRTSFAAHGLANRPVMANFAFNAQAEFSQSSAAAMTASGLDIVGINAYLPVANYGTPSAAAAYYASKLALAFSVVPAAKNIFPVMQAFDRPPNGFTVDVVAALQEPLYAAARSDSRVMGIGMFSYARTGGTLDHAELVPYHRRIAAALGLTPPSLIYESSTGDLYTWFMNGLSLSYGAYLSPTPIDPNWQVVGTSDFTGDGTGDLLLQHGQTGAVKLYKMNGLTKVGEQDINLGTTWKVVGTGDIDLDGEPDIVWENFTSGQVYVWFMRSSGGSAGFGGAGGVFRGDYVRDGASVVVSLGPTTNRIVSVADINQDGRLDLVWQDDATNVLTSWYLDGLLRSTTVSLTPASAAAAWRVRIVTDFDADGHPDLIWQNISTGELYAWFMNGPSFISGSFLNPGAISTAWRMVGPR